MAVLAGAGASTALRLGASMTLIQFAIGALNDIVDTPADAGRRPPKPIPSGIVSLAEARIVTLVSATLGLGLALLAGPVVLLLGIVVLAIGVAYDLGAKGTPWSWLPFAVGIPLLPIFGWVGATGSVPEAFVILLPMAFLAGAALAIANARSDLEADERSGTRSVATALGPERSWWVGATAMASAIAVGALFGRPGGWTSEAVIVVALGTAVVVAGLVLGRAERATTRRRAWEAQALGAAIAATGWVAGLIPGA